MGTVTITDMDTVTDMATEMNTGKIKKNKRLRFNKLWASLKTYVEIKILSG